MSKHQTGVIGIGYEGADLGDFIDGLRKWGVSQLVDVRLNPLSRKKGFSKRALALALAEADISYVHTPELGNPKDNRDGFADTDPTSSVGALARDRYKATIATEAGDAALRQIASDAHTQLVAVMCFERSELNCHRREVLSAVRGLLETQNSVEP